MNKKTRNLLEYLVFLIIPFSIFLFISVRNKNRIDEAQAKNDGGSRSEIQTQATEEAVLIKQGIALIHQKQYEKSIEIHLKALTINPKNIVALNNIGFAYGNLKLWDKGIAHCKKAILLDANFQLAKNNLNWMQGEKAKRIFQK